MSRRLGAVSCLLACALLADAAVADDIWDEDIEVEPPAQGVDAPRADDPLELTADSVDYEAGRKIYVARGNVRIVSRDTELTADWLAFNEVQSRGVATGNVVYRSRGDVLEATFVEFNLDSERGILFDGRFRAGENQFRMEGGEIVKHGDDTYSFKEGMFTTCRCPPGETDPWQIKADSADLEIGGYGTARNSTFEILGVPVIWLPWMIYPLKTERESGLLLPEVSYGKRNGADIGLPIFWAARDNVNVTLTPRWLSKRGAKGDLEVEYVLGERSKGEVFGTYLHDEEIDPNSRDEPFGRDRWAVRGRQDIFLPGDLRFKSNLQLVSDNEFLVDFDDIPDQRNSRFLQSNAFVGRDFGADGRFGGLVKALYADDLQNPTDEDRDKVLLQRFPTVELAALPAPVSQSIPVLSRIIPAFDADYTFFVPRERATDKYDSLDSAYYVKNLFIDSGIDGIPNFDEFGFDAVTNPDPNMDNFATTGRTELNGTFEEGELLADDGQRVDFFPHLGLPFRIGDVIEAYPEIGWHQTLYNTHFKGTRERHLLLARADLRSRLIRRFDSGLTHIVEPRIGYALVTDLGKSQGGNPLFVPETAVPQDRVRQLQLSNVTLDPADRIDEFNGFTFGVENRIYRQSGESGPRLIADFYISNEFRINGSRFGNIFLGGRAYPFEGAHLWANIGFDPNETNISEAIFQFSYASAAGHSLGLSYRYLRDIPQFFEDFSSGKARFDDFTTDFNRINQIRFRGQLAITRQWTIHHAIGYSFYDSLLLANRGGVEYTSTCRCWAAGIEISHDRTRGVRVDLVYRLLGLGKQVGYTGPDSASTGDLGLLDGI